jgi:hypothetical protein
MWLSCNPLSRTPWGCHLVVETYEGVFSIHYICILCSAFVDYYEDCNMMHGVDNIKCSHLFTLYLPCPWRTTHWSRVCTLIVFSIPRGRQATRHFCLWIVCEHIASSPQTLPKLVWKLFTNTYWHTIFAGVDKPLGSTHHAASSDNALPTFRDNVPLDAVQYSRRPQISSERTDILHLVV